MDLHRFRILRNGLNNNVWVSFMEIWWFFIWMMIRYFFGTNIQFCAHNFQVIPVVIFNRFLDMLNPHLVRISKISRPCNDIIVHKHTRVFFKSSRPLLAEIVSPDRHQLLQKDTSTIFFISSRNAQITKVSIFDGSRRQ